MGILFPSSPVNGDQFTYGTKTYVYNSTYQNWYTASSPSYVGAAEPIVKTIGMLWFNPVDITLGIWDGSIWQYVNTSNSVGYPDFNGQVSYTAAGTYSWTCPAGVEYVSVVCVGGGAGGMSGSANGGAGSRGGGGGGLAWRNDIPVVPGNSYTVVVGAGGAGGTTGTYGALGVSGGNSYFIDSSTVIAYGGSNSGAGGAYFPNGGLGGAGGQPSSGAGGGGGAGGYSGTGGDGGISNNYGSNGAGGGGAGGYGYAYANYSSATAYGGGGVGILGLGTSGSSSSLGSVAGVGGSGGGNAAGGTGGPYGGGGGAYYIYTGQSWTVGGTGGPGAVRIIWGLNRAFPSTNTGVL